MTALESTEAAALPEPIDALPLLIGEVGPRHFCRGRIEAVVRVDLPQGARLSESRREELRRYFPLIFDSDEREQLLNRGEPVLLGTLTAQQWDLLQADASGYAKELVLDSA